MYNEKLNNVFFIPFVNTILTFLEKFFLQSLFKLEYETVGRYQAIWGAICTNSDF